MAYAKQTVREWGDKPIIKFKKLRKIKIKKVKPTKSKTKRGK